jgi:hypothetical protein
MQTIIQSYSIYVYWICKEASTDQISAHKTNTYIEEDKTERKEREQKGK